jgi:hypothetical protein
LIRSHPTYSNHALTLRDSLTRVGNQYSAEVNSNLILEEEANYEGVCPSLQRMGNKTTLLMNILKHSEVVSGDKDEKGPPAYTNHRRQRGESRPEHKRLICSSLADSSTLKMEAIHSSETSVHTRSARRHIPEDGIFCLCCQ